MHYQCLGWQRVCVCVREWTNARPPSPNLQMTQTVYNREFSQVQTCIADDSIMWISVKSTLAVDSVYIGSSAKSEHADNSDMDFSQIHTCTRLRQSQCISARSTPTCTRLRQRITWISAKSTLAYDSGRVNGFQPGLSLQTTHTVYNMDFSPVQTDRRLAQSTTWISAQSKPIDDSHSL